MSSTTPETSLDDRPVWGAAAIAKILNRNKRQTYYLLHKQLVDADKIGDVYVSTPRRLLKRITGT